MDTFKTNGCRYTLKYRQFYTVKIEGVPVYMVINEESNRSVRSVYRNMRTGVKSNSFVFHDDDHNYVYRESTHEEEHWFKYKPDMTFEQYIKSKSLNDSDRRDQLPTNIGRGFCIKGVDLRVGQDFAIVYGSNLYIVRITNLEGSFPESAFRNSHTSSNKMNYDFPFNSDTISRMNIRPASGLESEWLHSGAELPLNDYVDRRNRTIGMSGVSGRDGNNPPAMYSRDSYNSPSRRDRSYMDGAQEHFMRRDSYIGNPNGRGYADDYMRHHGINIEMPRQKIEFREFPLIDRVTKPSKSELKKFRAARMLEITTNMMVGELTRVKEQQQEKHKKQLNKKR